MAQEIERKFLVLNDSWRDNISKTIKITQGYFEKSLNTPTTRIRIANNEAFITIKGKTKNISRSEFEYNIPIADAEAMLKEFCGTRIISKYRYHVIFENYLWEVDEYLGNLTGLFTAEIELNSEDETFPSPPWLGEDVSQNHEYSNGTLSQKQTFPI